MTTMSRVAIGHVQSMRAVVQQGYGGIEVLRAGEAPVPNIGAREALVHVHAAGLDRGTWHLMTGRPYLMRLMGFGFWSPKHTVVGRDLAGTVIEVGAEVSRVRVGDAVFGIGEGSFAEYARAVETKLSQKPEALTFEQAAVTPTSGLTALQALDAARVEAGQRVLIVGASGGVGTFAVQLARARGASVTGVCSTSKVELVHSLGAEEVIDYHMRDFTDSPERYDAILDIGGNTPLSKLRRTLTPAGTLVFVGGEQGGDWSAGFGRQLLAFAMSPFTRQRFVMLMNRGHYEGLDRLAEHVARGELRPVLQRSWPLAGAVNAMRELEAGLVSGKVAIVP
ncbi:MAG: NAD(P)-dependent alcohol dehydrogenase [Vicinamibacterales bacterium]